MKTEWSHLCGQLAQFIQEHNEIQLTANTTLIPQDRKIQFYDLFDNVRSAFLTHWRSDFFVEVKNLRKSLAQAEARVTERMNLEGVILPGELRQFLYDPNRLLMRGLFNLLFDHLKGKLDEKQFEMQALLELQHRYAGLYRSTYQKWATLVLLNLLEADRNYRVAVPSLEISARGPVVPFDPQPLPVPEASNIISCQHDNIAAFCAPEIIVHSKKIARYVSFRADLENIFIASQVLWTATDYAAKRKWYPIGMFKKSLNFQSAELIYVNDHLEDAALVADSQRLAQPDAILEFIGPDQSLKDGFARVSLYKENLMPTFGAFIIVPDATISSFESSSDADIKVLTTGLEDSSLNLLANVLIESGDS